MDLGMTRILALVTSTLAHRRRRAFSACLGRQLLATRGKIKLYKKYGLGRQEEEVLNRFWHFSGVVVVRKEEEVVVCLGGVSQYSRSLLKAKLRAVNLLSCPFSEKVPVVSSYCLYCRQEP